MGLLKYKSLYYPPYLSPEEISALPITAPDKYTVVLKFDPGNQHIYHLICDNDRIMPHEVIEEYGDRSD